MKVCPRCSCDQPRENFSKSSKSKDGLQGYCKSCNKELTHARREAGYFRGYRKRSSDKIAEARADWVSRNKERLVASNKRYREDNRDKVRQTQRRYREENPDRVSESSRNYREKNRHKYAMYASQRRFVAKQAQPSWLSTDDKKRMELMWGLAELKSYVTGTEYEVDHIVPLQGKTVCGLHVPWNLRVIPREDNRRKRNR
jgi:hypothetical protein